MINHGQLWVQDLILIEFEFQNKLADELVDTGVIKEIIMSANEEKPVSFCFLHFHMANTEHTWQYSLIFSHETLCKT